MRGTSIRAWSAAFLGVAALIVSACSHGGGADAGPGLLPYAAPQPMAGLRDRGRRAATEPVEIGVILRLNHRAQLERLVEQMSQPGSPRYHHFLTSREFNERFAPTAAQTRAVTSALTRAGFAIVQTYPGGTLIRARAATATVERYFHTRIDDFDQARYGRRYSNVIPARIPRAISGSVLGVELTNVVYAHAGPARLPSTVNEVAQPAQLTPESANAVRNPGFESGKLKPWYACGSGTPLTWVGISKLHPYSGKFDAIAGSPTTKSGEPNGSIGICQNVTIPPNAVLTAYLYQRDDSPQSEGSKQIVALLSPKGKTVTVLLTAQRNQTRWIAFTSSSLAAYAGKKLVLFFGVQGYDESKKYVTQFVDDVKLTSVVPASPTPSPLPPGPGSPIAGPSYGPDTFTPTAPPQYEVVQHGWGPLAVANGFDFPVQHGYNGTGVTAAVVIDGTITPTNLSNYKTAYDVHQTGTITTVPIASATPYGNDPLETTLDIETISGLAPGANIAVYDMPDLRNTSMEAAYQQILSDAGTTGRPHASVVNTSIDECETDDPTFDADVDQDAVHGAAIGITFVAASGDWGSTCYYDGHTHPVGVNAPAAAPHVLGVGGNLSYSSAGIANPAAWQNCDAGFNANYCASGGGVSAVFTPLPSYQSGIPGIASTTSRNVPDIAFPSVLDDIYDTSYGPTHYLIVGTSWSSPIAVALLTEAVQVCGPVGWVNPAIYSVYKSYGESPYFIDVTSGSNAGFQGVTTGYSAKVGYDNVTGLGMPNGATFVAALCRAK